MQRFNILKMACIAFAFCVTAAVSSPAQTVTSLADFSTNGYSPTGDLVQGFNGEFYGVTLYGPRRTGVGTFYDVTSSGTLSLPEHIQVVPWPKLVRLSRRANACRQRKLLRECAAGWNLRFRGDL